VTVYKTIAVLLFGAIALVAKGAEPTTTDPETLTSAPMRSSIKPPPPPPPEPCWWDGPYLTGDWGGERQKLADEGVTPYIYYNAIMAGNAAGGLKQGGPLYGQDLNFGLTFDMQKLTGWEGATININGVDRAGNTIRPDVGNLYDPMQLVGGSTAYLYNITLEQKFLHDIGSFKFGRLTAGDDFASSDFYGYYLNNGIDGQIKAVVLDTRFSTYPYPVWGARLRFDPSSEWNSMTGVYQVSNTMFNPNYNGLNMSMHGGYSLVQQFAWTPEFDKRPVENNSGSRDPKEMSGTPQMRGMPGHYAISGYFSNSDYSQFGTSAKAYQSYGFFAQADQMVYREVPGSDLGLYLWGSLVYAPQQNISIIPVQFSCGAVYKGLLPSRPEDRAIIGFIYGHFSPDYANTIAATGGGYPSAENVLEWGYRIQASQFAYIQPDVQYIIDPYGTGNTPNAVVIGAQFGLTF
jgi:porin